MDIKKHNRSVASKKPSTVSTGIRSKKILSKEYRYFVGNIALRHVRDNVIRRAYSLRLTKRIILGWLAIILIIIIGVGITRELSEKSFSENSFINGGTFSEAFIGNIDNLNPLFADSSAEKAFSKLAFSRLYDFDTSGLIKADLVDSLKATDNYRNLDITLRKDVKWSNNDSLDANDVIYTVNLMKDPSVNTYGYKNWKDVKITKKDDYRFEMIMPVESNSVLYSLNFPIMPSRILSKVKNNELRELDISKNMVTSGIFKFKSLQHTSEGNSILSLVRNENYYRNVAKLSRYEIFTYKDKENIKKVLLSGAVISSNDISLSDFTDSEKNTLKENQTSVNRGFYAFINTNDSIMKSIKVRKAVQHGIDMNAVRSNMNAVDGLDYPILEQFINQKDISPAKFDKTLAAKLLDDDGWKLSNNDKIRYKDGKKLQIQLATIKNSNLEKASKNIEKQLKELGFDVQLIVGEENDKTANFVKTIIKPRSYSILLYELEFGADPDIYAFWHYSQANAEGLNLSGYNDPVASDMLVNARKANNIEDKKKYLTAFTRRWLRDAPAIGIARTRTTFVYRKSVRAYDNRNKFNSEINRYEDISNWAVDKGKLYKTP